MAKAWPVYDRSGVEDSDGPIAAATAAAERNPQSCEILVCHAGTCRSRGAEAVLTEIEELASTVGATRCVVRRSGCLGYVQRPPTHPHHPTTHQNA